MNQDNAIPWDWNISKICGPELWFSQIFAGTKSIPRSLVLLEVGFLKYYPCKFTVSRQLPWK